MQPIDRRTFIADLGRGAFALAVVSVAACSPGTMASARPSVSALASASAAGFANGWFGAVGVVRRRVATVGQSPCP